jgi:hypothetical protein
MGWSGSGEARQAGKEAAMGGKGLTMTRRKFQTSAEEMLDSGLYLPGRWGRGGGV